MKLYDFDGMFDEKLTEYITAHAAEHTEAEWEDVIPELYKKFGDTKIKSLGKTPNEFYGEMSDDDLIKSLRAHLKQDVPVSEFLCSAIESRKITDKLMPLLDGKESEREYAMNLIGAADNAIPKYMEMLIATEDEDLKNRCVDFIKEKADLVLDDVIECYKEDVEPEHMLEIMSRSVVKKDEIFNILLKEFRTDPDNVPMNASYLAAYGDERALEYLLEKIDEEGITFVEYQELKFAIEALGGEYKKERDFSSDPYFQIINGHNVEGNIDLFEKYFK